MAAAASILQTFAMHQGMNCVPVRSGTNSSIHTAIHQMPIWIVNELPIIAPSGVIKTQEQAAHIELSVEIYAYQLRVFKTVTTNQKKNARSTQ